MEEKIQLKHPAGRHAVRMDKSKYEILAKAVLQCLKNKSLTHAELFKAVIANFKKHGIKFEGSVEWYMESVKLDLEANKLVERTKDKGQLKFKLIK